MEPGAKRHSALRPSLIADVGATNARFAVVSPDGGLQRPRVLACEDYSTIHGAIAVYLVEELPLTDVRRLETAALAIAGPVTGDRVTLTNHPWSFSIDELRGALEVEHLHVVNDFAAVAAAMPHLETDERIQVGGGEPLPDAPIGVLGPGSGLGAGGLVATATGWLPLPGEGGHATMAAANARESAVLDRMRARYDHVSAERVLSGPGLVDLYNTLAEIDGVPAVACTAAQITDPAACDSNSFCREAVEMFCAMLGTVAGNLALTLGARGGLYVAGGIVPKLGARFAASAFRERFEAKGRLRPYLAQIPTYVVTHPFPAFLGLAALLTRPHRKA
ncbi:MAG TPA: glucokinase [Xanthobacteraceae bacterium]|nr:glucokinase [Xanthobacteraceae bacterium]